jgi:hypothetical protein
MMLRAYPYIAAIALLIGLTVWIYMRGYNACSADQIKTIVKEEKAHAKLERKVMVLPDSDLDKRIARWLRD